jgi:hypothetical protein
MARSLPAVERLPDSRCLQGAKSNLWPDSVRAVFRNVPPLAVSRLHDFSLYDVGDEFVKQAGSKHHLVIPTVALELLLAGEKKRVGDCALVFSDLKGSKNKGKDVDTYGVYRCDSLPVLWCTAGPLVTAMAIVRARAHAHASMYRPR